MTRATPPSNRPDPSTTPSRPRGRRLARLLPRERHAYRLIENAISRRVEMPASTLSPVRRARTNIVSCCCFADAGYSDRRLKLIVTAPVASVAFSAGIVNWLYGTAVGETSAPATGVPQGSVTTQRGLEGGVFSVSVPG